MRRCAARWPSAMARWRGLLDGAGGHRDVPALCAEGIRIRWNVIRHALVAGDGAAAWSGWITTEAHGGAWPVAVQAMDIGG